jgi:hypothetical protein
MDTIRCRGCGTTNDLTAIACSKCGGSLVDEVSVRWSVAHDREVARGERVEEKRESRRTLVVVLVTALAVGGAVVAGYYGHDAFVRNFYLFGEPLYDNQPSSYWAKLLTADDHYIRRRAALALDTLADKINAATARTVVPDLKAALNDDDDVVRLRAASALEKIRRTTGEQ